MLLMMGSAASRSGRVSVLQAGCDQSLAFVRSRTAFVFDCDGVLWHGPRAVRGASDCITALRDTGRRVLFVTNNSTKARSEYSQTFRDRLGIDVPAEDVICSSWAAAQYLKMMRDSKSDARAAKPKVYVLGMGGIVRELQLAGFEVVGGPDHDEKTHVDVENELDVDTLDDDVGAVVVGLDRNINFYKISMAAAYVAKGCLLIASNADSAYPMKPNGTFTPGAGLSLVSVLNTVGRDSADVVAGKPSAALAETIVQAYGVSPETTCMVGDRLDTDMLFGANAGFGKLLVLSGLHKHDDADATEGENRPDFVAPSVATIAELLKD